mmetsp:Transcript_149482/g.478965  ORF Transcript_149482/g.478965 Transcript_149482/m.478965 type:complete len:103 (-) Transcript_149482:8-316(-)
MRIAADWACRLRRSASWLTASASRQMTPRRSSDSRMWISSTWRWSRPAAGDSRLVEGRMPRLALCFGLQPLVELFWDTIFACDMRGRLRAEISREREAYREK